MQIRRRLRPFARAAYRRRQRLAETTIGEAYTVYRSEAKPLGLADSWRLVRLLKATNGSPGLVRIRPRALGGAEIWLRRGTSDAAVAEQTFIAGLHMPPNPPESPSVVCDLGSNIGLTAAHYACLYPQARIIGVEPDPENAALARRNVAPWRDRCTIVECAVWHEDGEVGFEVRPGDELAGRIAASADARRVGACSLATLLQNEPRVDLLKVDIEGAEREVLRRNTEWAAKVRTAIVEVHEPYTVDECIEDLRRLGFEASVNPRFWVSVVGTR
jgi:FkbM family methyltransferase